MRERRGSCKGEKHEKGLYGKSSWKEELGSEREDRSLSELLDGLTAGAELIRPAAQSDSSSLS